MNYRKYFVAILHKHYRDRADSLVAGLDETYATVAAASHFAATSANPMDRRLDFTAYFLALTQVLERNGASFEQIRGLCLEVTHEYVRPKNALQAWLKKLPPKLIGTRLAHLLLPMLDRKIRTKGHPDGFMARLITDPAATYGLGYGIDILECGICKQFARHGASKYASILCEVDKLTSGLAGLHLIRSGTIANGAKTCDFRFKKQTSATTT